MTDPAVAKLQALVRIPTVPDRDPEQVDTAPFDAILAEGQWNRSPWLPTRLSSSRSWKTGNWVLRSAAPQMRECRMGTSETPGRAPGTPDRSPEQDDRTGRAAAAQRIQRQHEWVDLQIKQAMERGEFDNLPGAGKPIKNLGAQHDPDWWIKQLIEREKITGVLPPALQLRKDDAELEDRLDGHTAESEVRRILEEFNARVMKARYTPVDGPPLITMPRDVEAEVDAWRDRLLTRRRTAEARRAEEAAARTSTPPTRPRRRWFRRRGD